MRNLLKTLLVIAIGLAASGCPEPGSQAEPTPTPESTFFPSFSVELEAIVDGSGVLLSWDNPQDVNCYSIFRKADSGEFKLLDDVKSAGSMYFDKSCPVGCAVSYFVRFSSTSFGQFDSSVTPAITIPLLPLNFCVVNGSVHLSWPEQSGVEEIRVFRNVAGDSPVKLATFSECVNFYEDLNPPEEVEVRYSLEIDFSNGTAMSSTETSSIVITSLILRNLQASVLKYTDRITLTWYPEEDADYYKVLRYTSKVDQSPVVFHVNNNMYEDIAGTVDGPVAATPYFYKVVCVKGEQEYVPGANYVFGIFFTTVDSFEPNDLYNPPGTDEARNLIAGYRETAVLYAFADKSGSFVDDTDWYKFSGDGGLLTVHVDFTANSPLIGNTSLVLNDGTEYALDYQTNRITLEPSGELVFKVEFNSAGNDQILAVYELEIE